MNRVILAAAMLLLPFSSYALDHKVQPEHTQKARKIVSEMTLGEKIDYIGGYKNWYIRAVPRLGLPAVRMADGPQGVRNDTQSTLFPSGVTAAACWDRDLIGRMGTGLGQDARARGVQILLGPGVNIYRNPLCGRNFEYYGEDPYLASEMAVSYIRGVQSQNVMACIKHFAGNNQEYARHTVSTDVDLRTLNEIYLTAFEKAVKKADVASIMASYNLLNSVHSTENLYLLKTVLRDGWGFKGILMSDWNATYSPLGATTCGLDLEMPSPKVMNASNLLPLIENGVIDERYIDEKCVNIIQTLLAWGWTDKSYSPVDSTISKDNPFSDAASLDIARGAMTLLVNKDSFLPKTRGSFFVCGPHSDVIVTGSGSGNVTPLHTCTIFEGMQSMGKTVKAGLSKPTEFDQSYAEMSYSDKSCTTKGIKVEYFKGVDLGGKVLASSVTDTINYNWKKASPCAGVPADKFSARLTFYYKPERDEFRIFRLGGDDGFKMFIDGRLVCENWKPHSYKSSEYSDFLEAGKVYKFVIEYFDESSDASLDLTSSTCLFGKDEELKALAKAECALVCLGFNGKTEGEDFDRTFNLPDGQVRFLEKVAEINPNVVVVVNSGGSFEMVTWMDKAKAVIWAGYPGQMGGQAIAEIVTGKVCPSGRLPFSFESVLSDNPTADSYYENVARLRSVNPYSRVQYNEGLFMGYRGYDAKGVKPLFPFGYGLSYTSFGYSDIQVSESEDSFDVSFNVTNTGSMDGADVAQVYVRDLDFKHLRPVKELKGFTKFTLKKGESSRIALSLDKEETFRQYDSYEKLFKVNPGRYEILVGRSASDILLSTTISIE